MQNGCIVYVYAPAGRWGIEEFYKCCNPRNCEYFEDSEFGCKFRAVKNFNSVLKEGICANTNAQLEARLALKLETL